MGGGAILRGIVAQCNRLYALNHPGDDDDGGGEGGRCCVYLLDLVGPPGLATSPVRRIRVGSAPPGPRLVLFDLNHGDVGRGGTTRTTPIFVGAGDILCAIDMGTGSRLFPLALMMGA